MKAITLQLGSQYRISATQRICGNDEDLTGEPRGWTEGRVTPKNMKAITFRATFRGQEEDTTFTITQNQNNFAVKGTLEDFFINTGGESEQEIEMYCDGEVVGWLTFTQSIEDDY